MKDLPQGDGGFRRDEGGFPPRAGEALNGSGRDAETGDPVEQQGANGLSGPSGPPATRM